VRVSLTENKRKIKVKWAKTAIGTGYTAMRATDAAFTKGVKTEKATSRTTDSFTFEKPSWEQTIYVKARAYIKIGKKTYYSAYTKPKSITTKDEKWIDIDLSEQRVYTYFGKKKLKTYKISSGKKATPTIKGTFYIYLKLKIQDMRPIELDGSRGYVPNVPWVQYFQGGYALHGCYWHNNFGKPMSHGCINMRIKDAKALYKWSPMGTKVKVHK
jgi:lipoprotein-anchoring transpeptidase ErfK/SrfK